MTAINSQVKEHYVLNAIISFLQHVQMPLLNFSFHFV